MSLRYRRRFRCGQGALLSTMNQSTELSLHVMRIKSALCQKKVLLAALRPVNQGIQLLVKLHRGSVISRSASLDLSADARARQSSPSSLSLFFSSKFLLYPLNTFLTLPRSQVHFCTSTDPFFNTLYPKKNNLNCIIFSMHNYNCRVFNVSQHIPHFFSLIVKSRPKLIPQK